MCKDTINYTRLFVFYALSIMTNSDYINKDHKVKENITFKAQKYRLLGAAVSLEIM